MRRVNRLNRRQARGRVGEELQAKLTDSGIERPILEWQSLAVSVDRPVQWIVQSGARTLEHLQRDVRANDKAGAANDRDGHQCSLARARGNIEHAVTWRYFSRGEYSGNEQPGPAAEVAVIC